MIDRLSAFFKSDKGRRLIIITLIASAALIAVSSFFPSGNNPNAAQNKDGSLTAEEYERYTEQRLCDILKRIDGVGRCYVLVTVADSGETRYNTDISAEKETEYNSDGTKKESVKTENRYVITENREGDQSALRAYSQIPKTVGVVVVCDGGEIPQVRERIINAVKAALAVGSDKIFVTKT